VLAVSAPVPVVWGAAVALAVWWGSPWAAIAPVVLACLGTVALSRPVSEVFRALVARWTGTVVAPGYREPAPVTRMSTGYWWNGTKYARTEKEAREDQELRLRFTDPATWRDVRFTVIAPLTAGLVAAVVPGGVVAAVLGLLQPSAAARSAGALALLVAVAAAPHAWRPVEAVTVRFLRPTRSMELSDRVAELTAQRADTTVAQAAEIRRIERDLHDGAQARLVALGMSLATAEKLLETDPEQARTLLRQARAGAAGSLSELRELVRGISPPVLTERGLVDAVRAFALDSPLPVTVEAAGPLRVDPPIESAVYFGITELVTNAVKHARAAAARVRVAHDGTGLVAEVEDDGDGGALVRAGGGLAGLRDRLAVFDGTLEIDSPTGGPTRARMMVPCESW